MITSQTNTFGGLFQLMTRGRLRCRNVIIHPNGRLYGDVGGLACADWVLHEERICFVDHRGRIRFIFERAEGGGWNYGAPPRPPGPPQQVRYKLTLEGRGEVQVATPSADYQLLPQERPPGKRAFEIVVAKYKEGIAWTDAVPANVTIYSKDPAEQGGFPALANLGREGGTYFHHIITHYDDLAERTLFLQGDPFPHPLLALIEYARNAAPFTCAGCERSSIENELPWSSPAQRIDRTAMAAFLKLIECDPTMREFLWVQGAQFAVAREQIRRRPLDYYCRMHEVTQQERVTLAGRWFDNHHVAFLFELFWRYIFSEDGIRHAS